MGKPGSGERGPMETIIFQAVVFYAFVPHKPIFLKEMVHRTDQSFRQEYSIESKLLFLAAGTIAERDL